MRPQLARLQLTRQICSLCSPTAFPKLPEVFPVPHVFNCVSLICFLHRASVGSTWWIAITKHGRATGMQDDREETEAAECFTTVSKCHKAEALHAATAGAVPVALGALRVGSRCALAPPANCAAEGTGEASSDGGGIQPSTESTGGKPGLSSAADLLRSQESPRHAGEERSKGRPPGRRARTKTSFLPCSTARAAAPGEPEQPSPLLKPRAPPRPRPGKSAELQFQPTPSPVSPAPGRVAIVHTSPPRRQWLMAQHRGRQGVAALTATGDTATSPPRAWGSPARGPRHQQGSSSTLPTAFTTPHLLPSLPPPPGCGL